MPFILGVPLPKSECMACKSSIGLPDIQFICTCVLDINQDTEPNTLKKKSDPTPGPDLVSIVLSFILHVEWEDDYFLVLGEFCQLRGGFVKYQDIKVISTVEVTRKFRIP